MSIIKKKTSPFSTLNFILARKTPCHDFLIYADIVMFQKRYTFPNELYGFLMNNMA